MQITLLFKYLKWILPSHFKLLLAPFASKLVNYSRHSDISNFQKNSKFDVIFLQKQRFYRFQTFFKDSMCLQKLTNLDAKDAKISVKMWATNFYRSFFKNVLLYMNGRLSKISSVHTYGVRQIHVFASQRKYCHQLFINLLGTSMCLIGLKPN